MAALSQQPVDLGFLDVLASKIGYRSSLMVIREAYFDESGTHDKKGVLVVAGFIAPLEQWKAFSESLGPEFDSFHSKTAVESTIIGLAGQIVKHVECGFVVSIDQDDFCAASSHRFRSQWGSPYTIAMKEAAAQIALFADQKGISEGIWYHFDAGHRNQAQFNKYMANAHQRWPNERKKLRLAGWSFTSDDIAPPLRAADLLAHQYLKSLRTSRTPPALQVILDGIDIYCPPQIDAARAKELTSQVARIYEN